MRLLNTVEDALRVALLDGNGNLVGESVDDLLGLSVFSSGLLADGLNQRRTLLGKATY